MKYWRNVCRTEHVDFFHVTYAEFPPYYPFLKLTMSRHENHRLLKNRILDTWSPLKKMGIYLSFSSNTRIFPLLPRPLILPHQTYKMLNWQVPHLIRGSMERFVIWSNQLREHYFPSNAVIFVYSLSIPFPINLTNQQLAKLASPTISVFQWSVL